MTQTTIRPPSEGMALDSFAPENEPQLDPIATELELEAARKKYQYNHSYIAPVAMVDHLPREEMPSMAWWQKLIKTMLSILINATMVRHDCEEPEAHSKINDLLTHSFRQVWSQSTLQLKFKLIWYGIKLLPSLIFRGFQVTVRDFESVVLELGRTLEHDVLKRLHEGVKDQIRDAKPHHSEDCVDCLTIYKQQFSTIELPAIADYFHEDECFAYFRVAGPNPIMLERVRAIDEGQLSQKFPVTNDHFQSVMGHDDSLENAVAEGRLYLLDYAILEGALNGTYPDYQKYIDAPIALFAVPSESAENRNLKPVAIQCQQMPSSTNPIFTPPADENAEGRYAWEMAKRSVQVADSNFHEAVTHLGRTHLFMSPFVMATHRQLPKKHPIHQLLAPHFEGTLSINHGAHTMLIAPKGGVDATLAATIDCARALAATGVKTYGFNQAMLPNQLKSHGLDDALSLPVYPYRDDALLLWDAIQDWVNDYVHHYYRSDDDVKNDASLQAWVNELQAFEGGRVQDFGIDGKVETVDYLIQALTLLIFTASAQHAAVNFPQGDLMVYTPAMPLAGYSPAPTHVGMTHDESLQQLPPLHQSLEQLELTYLLGQIYHGQLGHYGQQYFADESLQNHLKRFQMRLEEIEQIIEERNESRPYPYSYLKPSRIPQSINI